MVTSHSCLFTFFLCEQYFGAQLQTACRGCQAPHKVHGTCPLAGAIASTRNASVPLFACISVIVLLLPSSLLPSFQAEQQTLRSDYRAWYRCVRHLADTIVDFLSVGLCVVFSGKPLWVGSRICRAPMAALSRRLSKYLLLYLNLISLCMLLPLPESSSLPRQMISIFSAQLQHLLLL